MANTARIARARAGLAGYNDDPDVRSNVVDLLTDLRHLCQSAGIDYDSADAMAGMHWQAEEAEREEI